MDYSSIDMLHAATAAEAMEGTESTLISDTKTSYFSQTTSRNQSFDETYSLKEKYCSSMDNIVYNHHLNLLGRN
jgi:hypothetical protein